MGVRGSSRCRLAAELRNLPQHPRAVTAAVRRPVRPGKGGRDRSRPAQLWVAQAAMVALARRRRRAVAPIAVTPRIIIAQLAGSGTPPVRETSLIMANGGTGRFPAARKDRTSVVLV